MLYTTHWVYTEPMSTPHYPTIDEALLTPFRAIELQLQTFPDMLSDPACPYTPAVRAYVQRLAKVTTPDGPDPLVEADSDALDVEIAKLYRTVKDDAATFTGTDTKDKMAFLKTANDLLTKLVDLQAKRFNTRNMARMQRLVVETLEEFLDPGQRTEFIKRLEAVLDV